MKNGWPIKKLAEVADSISTGPFGTMLHKSDYVPDGIPLVNPMNIVDSRIVPSAKMMISEETRDRLSNYVLRKGDVVVGRRGELGRCAIVTEKEDGWLCGTGSCFIRLSKQVDEHFFAMLFGSGSIRRLLDDSSVGTTMSNLNHGILNALPIPVPPLAEQRRIVGILDEAFEGLATAKANAEQNLQNARALFESHLQAVFTQRGHGWDRTAPLSSVLSVQPRNGWSPPKEYQTGTGIPVLTLSAVTGFEYDGSRVKLSSAPTRDDAHYWLHDGELLVTRSNTQQLVGHAAIYDGTPSRAICCDLIMKMQVDPTKAHTRFVYYYLRSPEARSYLTSRAQGASSTMKKIGKAVVQDIPIPLPSLAKQEAATEKLDALREETQRLESLYQRKLAALDELKKSLLHRAFSGEL